MSPQRKSQATIYLLSSKKNRKHLKKSIREAKIGKTKHVIFDRPFVETFRFTRPKPWRRRAGRLYNERP